MKTALATIAGAFIYALICGSAFFWKTAALATVAGNFPAVIPSWLPPFAERPGALRQPGLRARPFGSFCRRRDGGFRRQACREKRRDQD